jgi:hypothetical protein
MGSNRQCGPMLKYDTCQDNVYHSFALIVTVDETSDYSSAPTLQYHSSSSSGTETNGTTDKKSSEAIKLWQYTGQGGNHTFWRFKMEVSMTDHEQVVSYSINGQIHPDSEATAAKEGTSHSFTVPSKTQNFHWAGHSCNGFSAGMDESVWNGPDPLWDDMLKHHAEKPFHAVVGGGDQSEFISRMKERKR